MNYLQTMADYFSLTRGLELFVVDEQLPGTMEDDDLTVFNPKYVYLNPDDYIKLIQQKMLDKEDKTILQQP